MQSIMLRLERVNKDELILNILDKAKLISYDIKN